MVLTVSCPCPRPLSRAYGAHLHLQALEDPVPTACAVPSAISHKLSAYLPLSGEVRMKAKLRELARTRRTELAKTIPDFAARLASHAPALDIPPGSLIGAYAALPGEADPHLLLKALVSTGCGIAFPRVEAKGAPLVFHHWKPARELTRGTYSIAEPSADWPIAHPHILLIPLLAFDKRGHRLGYGGGYY